MPRRRISLRRLPVALTGAALLALAVAPPASALSMSAIRAPLPASAAPVPGAALNGVACTSVGNCVAVGHYQSGSGGEALVITMSGGAWVSTQRITPPSDSASDPDATLNAVSCSSPGDCVAVGQYQSKSGYEPLITSEVNGVWSPGIRAPLPSNAVKSELTALLGVSCPALNQCVAVGQYDNMPGIFGGDGFSVFQTPSGWRRPTPSKMPIHWKPDVQIHLTSISCPKVGYCIAVGQYENTSPSLQGLIETMTKDHWRTAIEAPEPTGAHRNPWAGLYSVSCPSWGNCVAVGVYQGPNGGQGVTITEAGGTWFKGVPAPLPHGEPVTKTADQLIGVSCLTIHHCVAVGQFTRGLKDYGVVVPRGGTSFGEGELAPRPSDAISPPYATLNGVDCPALGVCVMVGQYNAKLGVPALVVTS